MTERQLQSTAARLASRTAEAFSHRRFAAGEWEAACESLLERYSEAEAEAFLRSTYVRHGLDHFGVVRNATAADLMKVVRLLEEGGWGGRARRPRSRKWLDALVGGGE